MDKRFQIDNRGFSLVELLICLAISAFVIVSALSLVMVGTQNYSRANKATSLQQEMTFITNLVGQSIRDGKTENFSITIHGDSITGTAGSYDYEVHTGEKVIYYDQSKNSLYVYKDIYPVGASEYRSNASDNLVSKCVTSFEINFESPDSTTSLTPTPYALNSTITGESSLIKIDLEVKVKDKSDDTKVIYQIRN